jgi:hypothetical protein
MEQLPLFSQNLRFGESAEPVWSNCLRKFKKGAAARKAKEAVGPTRTGNYPGIFKAVVSIQPGTGGEIMILTGLTVVGEKRDLEVVDEDGIPIARTSLVVARDGNIVTIFLASSKLPNAFVRLAAGQEIPDLIHIINGETAETYTSRLVQKGGWLRLGIYPESRMISLEFPPGGSYVQMSRIAFRDLLVRI